MLSNKTALRLLDGGLGATLEATLGPDLNHPRSCFFQGILRSHWLVSLSTTPKVRRMKSLDIEVYMFGGDIIVNILSLVHLGHVECHIDRM